nr:cyclic peptide export ABC transporter [Pseudoruegeria sp. HB172150]
MLRSPVLLYSVGASFGRTLMIFAINETAARGRPDTSMIVLLLGSVVFALTTEHLARVESHILVQNLALKMRRNLSEHLLNADVGFFERRRQGEVFTVLTDHTNAVSAAVAQLVSMIEALLLLIFCLGYMFLQSWPAGVATIVALIVGVVAFALIEVPARRLMRQSHDARVAMHEAVHDVLRGYRELRLRLSRRHDISDRIEAVSTEVRDAVVQSERNFSYGQVAGTGALLALLVAIVVLLPLLTGAGSVVVLQVLTVVLFTFGPIEAVIGALPGFARAAVAYQQLNEVLADAASSPESEVARQAPDRRGGFRSVELKGIAATLYRPSQAEGSRATDSFTLGPIDLTLRPGQSVFITGGNGTGKSTLLQILTGLRHADTGQILLDGEPVTRDSVGEYRGLFSAVFSEFYMFRRLYGLSGAERARLQENIEELGLAEGVSVAGDAFSSLALSTGQMRRLALSVALAERRPILVLDEFAADQDPARRAFFYDVLVPRLAREGYAVVAVTHDEHCFGKADRLIRMEDGRIVADEMTGGGADRAVGEPG